MSDRHGLHDIWKTLISNWCGNCKLRFGSSNLRCRMGCFFAQDFARGIARRTNCSFLLPLTIFCTIVLLMVILGSILTICRRGWNLMGRDTFDSRFRSINVFTIGIFLTPLAIKDDVIDNPLATHFNRVLVFLFCLEA